MRRNVALVVAFVGVFALLPRPGRPEGPAKGLDIPLLVEEPGAVDRHGEPVRSGIPLPASAGVFDGSRFYLLGRGESGAFDREVPLSVRVTSRWGGPATDVGRPARWVLLDFPATVARGGVAEYRLRYDADDSFTSLTEGLLAGATLVAEDEGGLAVDTGTLRFRVPRDRFGVFDALFARGAGAGVRRESPFDVVIVDGEGVEYRASRSIPTEVRVEESAPLGATIVIRGGFRDAKGRPLLDGFAAYTIRLHVFAGSSEARMFFTLENNGFYGREAEWSASGGVARWLTFERLELVLESPLEGPATADIDRGFEGVALGEGGFRLRQDHRIERVPEDLDDESKNFVFSVETGRETIGVGARGRGAFRVTAGERAVSLAVRHFFENWPGALSFSDGLIRFEPWPPEGRWPPGAGDGPYVFEGGRWKTRELVFDFAGGDPETLSQRLARPLFARAGADWCAASGAMGPTAPLSFPMGNPASTRALARLNRMQEVVVDVTKADAQPLGVAEPAVPPISLLTQRESRGNAFKVVPYDVDLYGFMNFGDLPHDLGFCSLHYDLPGGLLRQYLRHDGFRAFLDIGEEMTRHRYDVDQYHGRETSHENWEYYNGFARVDQGWHGDYDRSAAYRSEGTPHPNYTWLGGLLLHHALTGDRRSLESARENADAFLRYARIALGAEGGSREIAQAHEVRAAALSIQNLVDFGDFTGEAEYLDAARAVFSHVILHSEELRGSRGLLEPEERHHLWNLVLLLEPLRKLHAATGDADVLSLLARVCRRLEGIYRATGGRREGTYYRPLQLPTWWREGTQTGTETPYGLLVADAFAWVFLSTGERSYMDFARWLFFDSVMYRDASAGSSVPPDFDSAVSYNPWKFPGTEVRVHAWTLNGHGVYLHAEWLESGEGAEPFSFPGDDFLRVRAPRAAPGPTVGGGTREEPPPESDAGATSAAADVPAVLLRSGLLRASFSATVPRSGTFAVAARWPAEAAGTVEYRLVHRAGERLVSVNRAGRGGEWVVLARLFLDSADEVLIDVTGADGIGRIPGEIRLRSE
jgi:hypothetical protein